MVNIDDFVKRLEIVLDYYGLNASAFADKIGVQRSSISHLLSGRNKPSLDFIMKILEVFPDVDLYWILTGKGKFPKNHDETFLEISKNTPPVSPDESFFSEDKSNEVKIIENSLETKKINFNPEDSEIEKIVLFYKNGTFKAFSP
ncbi:helix-turn-helix transcriptional regulator [Flavobacterium sp. DGU38]|uniref:Helix-turn-helix transcriptional regulator n=1 Tax=Flavobacterium calami TaxID=3139144 RepID=A0ABU9IP39_9FLAO